MSQNIDKMAERFICASSVSIEEIGTKLFLLSKDLLIVIVLPSMMFSLPSMRLSITFWLDSHWSGVADVGCDPETICPILYELDQIKKHPIKSHVIMIDDIRLMIPEHFKVTKEEIVNKIMEINPAYKTLSEGTKTIMHPISAQLHGSTSRNVDERAVDTYVNAWNTRESMKGNVPYRLTWSHDAEVVNMVNFHLELK